MRVEDVMLEMYSTEGITPQHPLFWSETLKRFHQCKNCFEWETVKQTCNEHGVCLTCYLDRSVQSDISIEAGKELILTIYFPSGFAILHDSNHLLKKMDENELKFVQRRIYHTIIQLRNHSIPIDSYLECENCSKKTAIQDTVIIQSSMGPRSYCSNACFNEGEVIT